MEDKEFISEIGKIINETLKTSIENYRMGFYIVIGFAILYFFILIFIQFKLKNTDVKNSIEIRKKAETLECLKNFYKQLNDIQVKLNDNKQKSIVGNLIKDLRSQLRCESIKLSNDSIKIINTILDLFSSAVIDSTQRERELEKRHLDNLKKEYKRA